MTNKSNKGDRLLLLIAAIAQNPGISKPEEILEKMQAIAGTKGVEFHSCSEATIRADIRKVIWWGIMSPLPNAAKGRGYVLGKPVPHSPPPSKRTSGVRKSKLTDDEIRSLVKEGASYPHVADLAGISKQRVGQISKERSFGVNKR